MNNEIRINIPEGMEIDKENSTFECIKFKPKKKELPKTWLEFCQNNPIKDGEVYIDVNSEIAESDFSRRDSTFDVNLLPSKEYAEAMLALCKLIQLRDCYNDGWQANWIEEVPYECIFYCKEKIKLDTRYSYHCILVFKSRELRDIFYINFKDLIEQAKLLL